MYTHLETTFMKCHPSRLSEESTAQTLPLFKVTLPQLQPGPAESVTTAWKECLRSRTVVVTTAAPAVLSRSGATPEVDPAMPATLPGRGRRKGPVRGRPTPLVGEGQL